MDLGVSGTNKPAKLLQTLINAKIYLGNLKSPLPTFIGYVKLSEISPYFGSMQLPLTSFFKATLKLRRVVRFPDMKTQLVIRYSLLRIGLKTQITVNG